MAQIRALDLQCKSTTCLDKTCVLEGTEPSESEEEDDDNQMESEEESLNVLSKNFEDTKTPLAINKVRHWNPSSSRNYYPRPTPPDLQYEEQGSFASSSFDGTFVHTWNIDGKSKHEILSTLQKMTMAAQAYKTRGFSDKHRAIALVLGF